MSVPYHVTCTQPHPLLYPLADGRFQIMEKGSLAPLMIGVTFVVVESSLADYLGELDIQHLQIVDAVLYDPSEKKEIRGFKQLLVDLHFLPSSISSIDLTQDCFLWMDERYLFVSPSLKDKLKASPFKYFRFHHGLIAFAASRYSNDLPTVDDLRTWNVGDAIIESAEEKIRHLSMAPGIALRIREAFLGVTLGAGRGLWQAQAIDDYEDEETVAEARATDEKEDWARITTDDLNSCESSLSFFDAEGMRFHLPAYLIADLEQRYLHGMAFCLTDIGELRAQQFSLLSPPQRAAICEYLNYIAVDEDYEFQRPNILRALQEYWTE